MRSGQINFGVREKKRVRLTSGHIRFAVLENKERIRLRPGQVMFRVREKKERVRFGSGQIRFVYTSREAWSQLTQGPTRRMDQCIK